ncbi:MAG: lysylphosphatidylglycerol synthase transmembrane domain-containing protein [Candidatus Saccharibacteria bacterium]
MQPKAKLGFSWLRIGYISLAAIAMYALVSQLSDLNGALSQLKNSKLNDDILVLIAVIATFSFAALTYYFIALKPLRYFRTLFVEMGINTLNRLLPAGIGGIGANYVYLTKSKHSKAQAGAVVAANTIIGVIANLILLSILLAYFPIKQFRYSSSSPHLVIIGCLIVLAAALIVSLVKPWRQALIRNLKLILKNISGYRFLKLRLFYGLLCQIGLCLANVLALYFSLRAVGGSLPIGSLMLAYSFGIWLGAVIPAPGGVGSVEAGLVTGLLAFKIDLTQAVAAVLIFRLISFWLPLIFGTLPLLWSYRKGYL